MAIASSGDVSLLVISGSVASEALVERFEQIVKRNSELSGDRKYGAYFDLLKEYSILLAEYTILKALLIKMSYELDWEDICEVRRRGYKIDLTNSETYAASLYATSRRVDNIVTRARMKQKEMERLQTGNEDQIKVSSGFEEVMANLNFGLGFNVDENITLARYNEYKKILKAKYTASRRQEKHALTHG